jgi:hypothetical protein
VCVPFEPFPLASALSRFLASSDSKNGANYSSALLQLQKSLTQLTYVRWKASCPALVIAATSSMLNSPSRNGLICSSSLSFLFDVLGSARSTAPYVTTIPPAEASFGFLPFAPVRGLSGAYEAKAIPLAFANARSGLVVL